MLKDGKPPRDGIGHMVKVPCLEAEACLSLFTRHRRGWERTGPTPNEPPYSTQPRKTPRLLMLGQRQEKAYGARHVATTSMPMA